MVLCPVAGIGATLSFQSLYEAALPIFGTFAVGFPLLADMLILGSTLAFLAGAIAGRPLPGWRWTAHAGVTTTLALNALAASSAATIPWHVTPALVWSILVEMTARQVTRRWESRPTCAPEPIPIRLWMSSPVETTRTWLQMARTGEKHHRQARAALAVQAAAVQSLKTAMPRRRQRAVRVLIRQQLRAGALTPGTLLGFLAAHDRASLADDHLAVIIQAFLTGDPLVPEAGPTGVAPGAGHPSAAFTLSPALDGNEARQAGLPPPPPARKPRSEQEHQHTSRPVRRSRRASDQRLHVAAEILRAHPQIDAPHLLRELADRGWHISPRTARRVLALARS